MIEIPKSKEKKKPITMADLKMGDYVVGKIHGVKRFGRILLDTKGYGYFLQNSQKGSTFEDNNYGTTKTPEQQRLTNEFSGSWCFKQGGLGPFSDGVRIDTILTKEEYEEEKKNIPTEVIYEDGAIKLIGKDTNITICNYQSHPDCCGAIIYYGFCESNKIDYSKYKALTDKDKELIVSTIQSKCRAAKIAHIAHYQTIALELLKDLGFTEICQYENLKSGNNIHILQLEGDPDIYYDEDNY